MKRLTSKEWELLHWYAEGYKNDRIAELTHRSPQTISNLAISVKRKMGAQCKTEAVSKAFTKGWVW
jgi:DNA-binding NarL/FixJ family response regulator